MERINSSKFSTCLIIDIASEGIFALYVNEKGSIIPLDYFGGKALCRREEAELNLDQVIDQLIDEEWNLKSDTLNRYFPLNAPGSHLSSIDHPFDLLKRSRKTHNESLKKPLAKITAGLLRFLLEPVFKRVMVEEPDGANMSAYIVVPGNTVPEAMGILRVLLMEKGFTKCIFIDRAIAAAMHLLKDPYSNQVGAVESGTKCSHISHIDLEYTASTANFAISKTETIENFGWDSVISNLTNTLNSPDSEINRTVHEFEVDRALKTMSAGITGNVKTDDIDLPAEEINSDETQVLVNRIQDLQAEGKFIIPYGLTLSCPQLQQKLAIFDQSSPFDPSSPISPLERPARGVLEMLNWLYSGPDNRIQIRHSGSLRLTTMDNTSIELVPFRSIPQTPGQEVFINQRFEIPQNIESDKKNVTIALQWGTNRHPAYNIDLLQITFRHHEHQRLRGGIDIAVKLKLHEPHYEIKGSILVNIGGTNQSRNIRLPRFFYEINQHSLEQTTP
jgi:hypothetical protein